MNGREQARFYMIKRVGIFGTDHDLMFAIPVPPESHSTAARIKKFSTECGCSLGAKFLAVTLGALLIWGQMSYGIFSWQFLKHLPLGILAVLLSAGVGKFIGIAIARHRLRLELARLDPALFVKK